MEIFTQVGAAEYIGTSKQQMYRYTKMGRIKLNSNGRIDKGELDRFLKDQSSKYGSGGRRSPSPERTCVARAIHDATLSHFASWLYQELAPALSGVLVEKKVSKKANLEICKELFDLMNWFSMEYNTADILNKLMMEGGEGFDEIHFALTGERIKSKPSDLNIQIPNTYLDLLTPKERTRLEKIFIK